MIQLVPIPGARIGKDGRDAFLLGTACFVILLMARGHVLTQPPTWDGAMGMTPAALTLATSGFDIPRLLDLPTYYEGGPNTHALSLVTLATAVAIALAGDYASALPILHIASFIATGALVAGVYLLVVASTEWRLAGLLAASLTVLYPPTLVQASDVYLDLPLAAVMVWAVVFAVADRRLLATLAASIAIWIKPTGVVLVPVLAYLMLTKRSARSSTFKTTVHLAVPSAIAIGIFLVGPSSDRSGAGVIERVVRTFSVTAWHTVRNPSLLISFALTVWALSVLISIERQRELPARLFRLTGGCTATVVSTVVFYLLNPLATSGHALLTRYTVTLTPFLAVLTTIALWHFRPRVAVAGVIAGGALFMVGMFGALSAPGPNNYSLSERDLSYEHHLTVQSRGIRELEQLAVTMPVLVDHFTYFRFAYPEMGWVSGDVPLDVRPVFLDRQMAWSLDAMPREFALLYEHPWLGGETLNELMVEAEASPLHSVEVFILRSGEFENFVAVVRTLDSPESASRPHQRKGGSRSGT